MMDQLSSSGTVDKWQCNSFPNADGSSKVGGGIFRTLLMCFRLLNFGLGFHPDLFSILL